MSAPRSAPLETFLTGVADRNPRSGENISKDGSSADPLVILTILSQIPVMPNTELMAKSEMPTDRYQQALKELQRTELIEMGSSGYSITPRGREVAEKARSRLLSSW